MEYFYIRVIYTKRRNGQISTGHVVRAENSKNALDIATRHGIAYPFNTPLVKERTVIRIPKANWWAEVLIERRRHGRGGKIFYEDKDGKLQIESNEKNKTK